MRLATISALAVLCAQSALAQGNRTCNLIWDDLPPTNHYQANKNPVSGKYTTWWGGGFKARCRGTKMIVSSDSAEYSEDTRIMTLIGNARYREDSTAIDAHRITYMEVEQVAIADSSVRATTRTGTTLTADQMRYLRPQGRTRPFASAFATGHSHLVMRDSVKAPDSLTTTIDSDRLRMERDSLFYAGGHVVITRTDIIAKADSAEANSGRHTARMVGGSPRIDGAGASRFTIQGTVLDVFGQVRQIERLFAKGKARAVSDSLTLTADTLDIRTTGTVIDRVFAWGPGTARATAPDRDVVARRIELVMPGQRMRDLIATGNARADSRPDSTLRSKERDWIVGDTIVATFDQAAAVQPGTQPPLKVLTSRGNAKSFYQVPPKERLDTLPTLSYVVGKRIQIQFRDGVVQDVRVQDQVMGIHLAPKRDSTQASGRAGAGGGGR